MERYQLIWNWDTVVIGRWSVLLFASLIWLCGFVSGVLL